jgi:3-hydroxyisobutyrate dehydrogenase-like beta-hydroxyacid dehydrogenase
MSPATSSKTVGVIGLGIMGGAFSRNLVAAGWRVTGFDVAAGKRKELAKAGVEIVRDAKAVAAAAPIIITSLPKPEALIATAKEIAKAKLPSRIIAECSTFNIEDKEKAEKILRAAGHVMLDCPVSGTGSQARTGDLVIYASGDPKSVVKVKPMFAGFSRKMYDVGAFAKKMRVPTPLFSATLPVYAAALKSGHADDDTAAVCAVLEAKANVKRRRAR